MRKAEQRLAAAEQAAAQLAAQAREGQANLTDPDSRVSKSIHGWAQGLGAQAAVNRHQIGAAQVTQDAFDVAQLRPMIDATQKALDAVCGGTIGMVLADAGYWSQANATASGPDRLIAATKSHKLAQQAREQGLAEGPPPEGASAVEAMEHRGRAAEGQALLKRRGALVEPVFGQTKQGRGIRSLLRRGLPAAGSEWRLICLTHNILKLHRHHLRKRAAVGAGAAPALA